MKNRVKEIRNLRGISQDELGERIGLRKAAVSKLERGLTKLTTDHIAALSKALDCEPWEILGSTPDKKFDQGVSKPYGLADGPAPSYVPKIPVWGTYSAENGTLYAVGTDDTPIDFTDPLPIQMADKDAFNVMVDDETMAPMFVPGHIACVNTRRPVIKGNPVIAVLASGGAMLKIFIGNDGADIVLNQLNPDKDIRFKKKDVVRLYAIVGAIFR